MTLFTTGTKEEQFQGLNNKSSIPPSNFLPDIFYVFSSATRFWKLQRRLKYPEMCLYHEKQFFKLSFSLCEKKYASCAALS